MTSSWLVGLISIGILVIMLVGGVPIGLTMLFLAILGLFVVSGVSATFWAVNSVLFQESFHWVFIVLPMFFLLGNFAFHGDIGRDAYNSISKWLGQLKGGLLIATVAACAAMGFASGSSLATAVTFTRLGLPEMRKHGYDLSLSCGAIASAGTLAALIPPSGMMVVFCVLTGASLGRLLIAGIFPGFLTAFLFIVALRLLLKFRPNLAPSIGIRTSFKEKLNSSKSIGPLLLCIVSIMGGLYIGVFTPTEAGAAGAMVTFIFLVARYGLSRKRIMESLLDTVRLSSMIFIIIIGALLYGRFLSVSGTVEQVSKFILSMQLSKYMVMLFIIIIYLILGTFLEAVAILALTLPIFFPILKQLGFDETLIGIVAVMLVEIGVLTPPLGTNVYAVKAAAGDIVTMNEVFRGIWPFFFAYLASVGLVVAFPQIALFLPGLLFMK